MGAQEEDQPMPNRQREADRLAQTVEQAFLQIRHCPRSLTARADPNGNIVIELHRRTFIIAAEVVVRTIASDGWCESVLHLVLGVPGAHVLELLRAAKISAGLTAQDLEILTQISTGGPMCVRDLPEWFAACKTLADKGLLELAYVPGDPMKWALTQAGQNAVAARS
jgi:hypothetical protein